MTRVVAVFTLAAGVTAVAAPALAQPLSRDDLQAALAQRDAEIAALEKRVAALESEKAAVAQPTPASVSAASSETAAAAPTTAAADTSGKDDDVALQALSRGLVQRGLLLLSPWSVEIAPSLAYNYTELQGLVLVDTPDGVSTVNDQRQRDDDIEGAITARVGMPWRSQLQVTAPYDWKREASALGDGTVVTHTGADVGDVQVELSHQFVVESGWRPDVIGAIAWRFPTGSDPYRVSAAAVATGLGTNEAIARVTVLKTIDPLVVFSTVAYGANLPYKEQFGTVHAGDSIDWQLGGLLAVSPDTSLSFGLDQQFRFDTRVNGGAIAGSNGVAAVGQFGLDQVLSSRVALDLSLGIGLTRDAPSYSFMVSLPIRLR
jgi:hypothetical protein